MALTRLSPVSGDLELIRYLLVGIPGGDQAQHADLCRRQGVIRRMLSDFIRAGDRRMASGDGDGHFVWRISQVIEDRHREVWFVGGCGLIPSKSIASI
jgi:hypothetical protein